MTRLNLLAALVASVLCFAIPPAHSAEIATQGDTARFLAGMPPSTDSPLMALTKSASWQEHAKAMDRAFAVVEKTTLSKVRDWSAEHLKSPQKALLYMFSGPDFLYANAFFPNASTYIMAGLEPAGEIPDLVKMQRRGVVPGLGNLQNSMRTLLAVSFFITKDMQTNLRETGLRGTIPILYVFLARSGKQVHDTSLVTIDDDGAIQPENPKAKSSAHGVKIVFAGADGSEKTLYYFTTNLANDGVKRGGFLKFCETLAPFDAFHKSASYLMHNNEFSRIREFILDKSMTIVQDDSGIPYRSFDPKIWQLQPFGHYHTPTPIFGLGPQPKANELFKNAAKLDFGIGYRWRVGESNLLLAVKRAP